MQNNINSDEIRSLQIVVPPIDLQRSIVAEVEEIRAEIARQTALLEQRAPEIDAEMEALIRGTQSIAA